MDEDALKQQIQHTESTESPQKSLNIFGPMESYFRHNRRLFTYLLILVLIVVLMVIIRYNASDSMLTNTVDSILIALFAAATLGLLAHLGAVVDTRKISDNIIEKVNGKIEKSSIGIVDRVSQKIDAKYKFGLEAIEDNLDETILLSTLEDSRIFWLNTKFNDERVAMQSIQDAIERGNRVRLMLMEDSSFHAIYRGAYTCGSHMDSDLLVEDVKNYRASLIASNGYVRTQCNRIKEELERNGKWDGDDPQIELRFYNDPAGMPMFLIELRNGVRDCYSGFYLNSYSRQMPYLRWYGPERRMVDNLFDYFNKKWFFASDAFSGFDKVQAMAQKLIEQKLSETKPS